MLESKNDTKSYDRFNKWSNMFAFNSFLFVSYIFFVGWFVCGFGCLYLHSNGTSQYCWCLLFYGWSLFVLMCVVAWCGESRKSSLKNGLFMKTTQLQGKTVLSYVWFDSLVSCMKNWFWSYHNSRLKCLHFESLFTKLMRCVVLPVEYMCCTWINVERQPFYWFMIKATFLSDRNCCFTNSFDKLINQAIRMMVYSGVFLILNTNSKRKKIEKRKSDMFICANEALSSLHAN